MNVQHHASAFRIIPGLVCFIPFVWVNLAFSSACMYPELNERLNCLAESILKDGQLGVRALAVTLLFPGVLRFLELLEDGPAGC